MNKNANKYLSKEVADQFKVTDWSGGHRQVFGRFGVIDLKELTITRANALVEMGFRKLVRKKITSQSSPENNSEEKK
ncbi:MAG TPA: hypothetical protein PK643_03340 [Saprospiraceae bacterium]|nr:hypothetical protein [Saprospiraceae bacterium]